MGQKAEQREKQERKPKRNEVQARRNETEHETEEIQEGQTERKKNLRNAVHARRNQTQAEERETPIRRNSRRHEALEPRKEEAEDDEAIDAAKLKLAGEDFKVKKAAATVDAKLRTAAE